MSETAKILPFQTALASAVSVTASPAAQHMLDMLGGLVESESAPIQQALREVAQQAQGLADRTAEIVFSSLLGRAETTAEKVPLEIARAVDGLRAKLRLFSSKPKPSEARSAVGKSELEQHRIRAEQAEKNAVALAAKVRELENAYAALENNIREHVWPLPSGYEMERGDRPFFSDPVGDCNAGRLKMLAMRQTMATARLHRYDESNTCVLCGLSVAEIMRRKADVDENSRHLLRRMVEATHEKPRDMVEALVSSNQGGARGSLLFCSGTRGVVMAAGVESGFF